MTSTTTYESAVAAAFAAQLPTAAPTVARASQVSGDTGEAVVVQFIGEASAQVAVQIFDTEALIDGLASAPLADRLRDALEASVSALGSGALGEAAIGDASAAFSDPQAQVFDLQDPTGRTIGRLAVNVTRSPAPVSTSSRRLHRIAGVEMELTVEIGRTRMAVRDVLDLEPGRIVELDRSAGAPADVKLNGRIIAHGEVVVVDQDYAVRITRILENVEV
ncbi:MULTISPECIES: flagellar motor switch protein FliN [unclassified Microbacterium]|uniref:flagellar motor switch protein FliN n=1 Tax=unclassified Microbacterium TaxID=2609290 RepID=UPI000EAAA225|nr:MULTISPECIES: flagellar motor switch protein FliN [unclassified Microbacterium]MBT2485031.1 flagellar motor switch protein FliN [Microbacterium sp. ISL-108]RKN67880.1 flagellar motor switch protein FliN [Microbacterium sp. CGR2]